MNKDIKAINESYNQGINHTTRNTDSYAYAVKDYSTQRNEQEEKEHLTKRRIAFELNNMTKRAARGLKEDYMYIMSNMNKLHNDINDILTKI